MPKSGNFTVDYKNKGGMIPAGTVRVFRYPPFSRDAVKDFLNTSVEGSIAFKVLFGGAGDAGYSQQLTMKLHVTAVLSENPKFADVIVSEEYREVRENPEQ